MQARIRAIFFDLDDTLCKRKEASKKARDYALNYLLSKHPELVKHDLALAYNSIVVGTLKLVRAGTLSFKEYQVGKFRRLLRKFEIKDEELAIELRERYYTKVVEELELFPEILPTLKRLNQKFLLGIITDGNQEHQLAQIEKLGIKKFFRFICVSDEVGFSKPAKEIFLYSLRKSDLKPEEVLYVGDSQLADVVGAKRVGMKVVWINRIGERLIEGVPKPDWEIRSLDEILKILK
jgi:putative hydrolase of the HAD superfamily